MAGAFGYNKETYKVSIAMANAGLLPEIKSSSPDNLIIADGISCRCQIKDNTSRNPQHAAVTLDNHLDHAMLSNSGFR